MFYVSLFINVPHSNGSSVLLFGFKIVSNEYFAFNGDFSYYNDLLNIGTIVCFIIYFSTAYLLEFLVIKLFGHNDDYTIKEDKEEEVKDNKKKEEEKVKDAKDSKPKKSKFLTMTSKMGSQNENENEE